MSNDLENKTAFITGAAHGQGRATALALAKEGVDIIAFDIAQTLQYPGYRLGSSNDLETLKTECDSLGVQCFLFEGDVRVDEDILKAVRTAEQQFGKIDILFNNA